MSVRVEFGAIGTAMNLEFFVGLVLLVAGVLMCTMAYRSRCHRLRILGDGVRVHGKIVRFVDVEPSPSSISESASAQRSSAVVEYRDKERRRHEMTLPEQSTHHRKIGDKVAIVYERGNPANASAIDGTWDVNLILMLCMLVLLAGVGFLITAYQSQL